MANDLLSDREQLGQDAAVLEAWADCAARAGGRDLGTIRRAAAALREVAAIYSFANLGQIAKLQTTCAPELLTG